MTRLSDIEGEVVRRYARAARTLEPGLCCADGRIDPGLLEGLPQEIVEKDYGCGNPVRFAAAGDTVVDLGSGSGKSCYALARKVGPGGRVIGVDLNDAMLEVARRHQDALARRPDTAPVDFVKARIQDLALDLDRAEAWLREHPASTLDGIRDFERECARLRIDVPAVPDGIADLVVSNCVLNLVRPEDRIRLFADIHRVLKRGGRAVISDIVCDEDPTPAIRADPALWSGCIAGAFREDVLLQRFEEAGFYGVEVLDRQERPWQVIEGIEFRSVTVRAWKGKEGACLDRRQAVIYRGPWREVADDDGHTFHRGRRVAVCDKTFGIVTDPAGPYAGNVFAVPPYEPVPADEAPVFACRGTTFRDPKETKGRDYRLTRAASDSPCCANGSGCCEPGTELGEAPAPTVGDPPAGRGGGSVSRQSTADSRTGGRSVPPESGPESPTGPSGTAL